VVEVTPGVDASSNQIQTVLDTVDELQQVKPQPQVRVVIRPKSEFGLGTSDAQIHPWKHEITLAAEMLHATEHNQDVMPSAQGQSPVRYTLYHEWGHLTDPVSLGTRGVGPLHIDHAESQRQMQMWREPGPSGRSGYGGKLPQEAYAEAWAEWHLTGGKTTNEWARRYADEFGWAR
jgi:hypothetical protein